MAYPASHELLDRALQRSNNLALNLQDDATRLRDESALGDTQRVRYVDLMVHLKAAVVYWNQVKALPGIAAFASDVFGDPTLDVAAEFTAMVSAADALAAWLYNNVPKDVGTDAQLERAVQTDGSIVYLTFTSVQTAGFRTQVDAFVATIG